MMDFRGRKFHRTTKKTNFRFRSHVSVDNLAYNFVYRISLQAPQSLLLEQKKTLYCDLCKVSTLINKIKLCFLVSEAGEKSTFTK